MLNRYGLFDIEKFLREQDEPQDPAAAPADGAPAAPAEDPNEKINSAREGHQSDDLDSFRKEHADEIFQIAKTYGVKNQDFDRNADLRELQQKFGTSGVDKPFFILFDPATTGLSGARHLSLIASLLHDGKVNGNQVKFQSAGDASSFAEGAATIRDDLTFAVDEQDRTVVRVAGAAAPPVSAPAA